MGFFGTASAKRPHPSGQSSTLISPTSPRLQSKGNVVKEAVPRDDGQPPAKKARKNAVDEAMPLAERMRPRTLDEFIGQEDLVGSNGVLRELILTDRVPSMILWAGPGVLSFRVCR
jgi:putative ATPase